MSPPNEMSLDDAFGSLWAIKTKGYGEPLSDHEIASLKAIKKDLLPNAPPLDENLDDLVAKLCSEDTRWNQAAQATINQIYELRASNKEEEADAAQRTFCTECPSSWYRAIVGNV